MPWRERALELQRERLVRAMAALACERGFAAVSTASLCTHAGVSRSRFYELFDSREACFLAVLDEGYRHTSMAIRRTSEHTRDWREGVQLGLVELLLFFQSEPELTRVCLVESLAAGRWALEARERYVASLLEMIRSEWRAPVPPEPHPLTNVGIAASVLGIVQNHLLVACQEPLLGLLGPLVGHALAPYLSASTVADDVQRASVHAHTLLAARASVVAPSAPTSVSSLAHSAELEAEYPARIPNLLLNPQSHRARETICHLADRPGASNRQIATAIGIVSHPQISKLLTRLAREGLLVKHTGRPGHPNSWSLTSRGDAVAEALRGRRSNGNLQASVDAHTSDTIQTPAKFTVTS